MQSNRFSKGLRTAELIMRFVSLVERIFRNFKK